MERANRPQDNLPDRRVRQEGPRVHKRRRAASTRSDGERARQSHVHRWHIQGRGLVLRLLQDRFLGRRLQLQQASEQLVRSSVGIPGGILAEHIVVDISQRQHEDRDAEQRRVDK